MANDTETHIPDENPAKLAELIPTTKETNAPAIPKVVTAPVLVLPPSGSNRPAVNIGVGVDDSKIEGSEIGLGNVTGRDANPSYSSAGSVVNFTQEDNAKLWEASMRLLQETHKVALKLDNLPEMVDKLVDKVAVLEKLQIAVKVEPIPVVVPMQTIYNLIIGIVIALAIVALAFWLGGKL